MNWASRLLSKVIMGMQKGAASAIQQELKAIQDELLKGNLDPSRIAEFAKKMGIDIGQLSGVMGQQPGFDPYMVLNLNESASDEEVRQRYLELIGKLHPDRAGSGFEFLATLVNMAYQAICRQRGIK